MNDMPSVHDDGEIPIHDFVKDLTTEEIDRTVRVNAAKRNFDLNAEHLAVIHTLIDHYRQDCKNRDCLAAHEHMRYLEHAYADRGGSKYLYMLFDALPDSQGVLTPIHELAGLPALRLQEDKGFGTAF